jgi:hypothetical protein
MLAATGPPDSKERFICFSWHCNIKRCCKELPLLIMYIFSQADILCMIHSAKGLSMENKRWELFIFMVLPIYCIRDHSEYVTAHYKTKLRNISEGSGMCGCNIKITACKDHFLLRNLVA